MNKDNNKYEEFDDEFLYEEEEKAQIDWVGIFQKLYTKKKLFIISFFITIIIALPLALSVPRYYAVEVKLAPEFSSMSSNSSSLGNLSSLMRSFGIGSSTNSSGDAILPTLYPDLMNSKAFMVSLFDVPIQTKKGEIKTTYYQYLSKYQKAPIWSKAIGSVLSLLPADNTDNPQKDETVNAGSLTKKQTMIAKLISNKVVCDIDNKTGVITINVTDQDPVVCADIANATCQHLQDFITEYRTKKSRLELQNVQKQYAQAKKDYEQAKAKVESFNDSNWDLVDEEFITEKQALQNDMQLKFTNMSAFNQQLLSVRSKYESMRPVFTILDGASVPVKPAGPSRKKIILVLLFLVLGGEAGWILFKDKAKKTVKSIKTLSDKETLDTIDQE